MKPQLLIHGYRFELTSFACPEQYDVYDTVGNYVAYCRLRHGTFRVHCPDIGGKVVYETSTIGDGYFNDAERLHHLYTAVRHVQAWVINEMMKPIKECEE